MKIIIKFILKNIAEKKLRTFLILFSIMISSALFFASSAISGTMEKMFLEQQKKYVGTSDLIISSNEHSPSPYFSKASTDSYQSHLSYMVGSFETTAFYKPARDENVTLQLQGIDFTDLQTMNPISLAQQDRLLPFEGKKIIISKNTAEKYGFSLGDRMKLEINGALYSFEICGISHPTGAFKEDGRITYAIVPINTLSGLYNARGQNSLLYIKLKNPNEKQWMMEQLQSQYSRYTVKESIPSDELESYIGQITTPFMLMVIIVFFMSMFIIYTSFKLITTERLPVIGTFRSIGATRKTTNWIMVVESLLYGMLGGLLGCGLGVGILYIMSAATASPWDTGMKATVEFTFIQLTWAFLAAVLLSLFSALIPIIKISKIPVKDIVLNHIEKGRRRKIWKPILGILFLAVGILVPPLVPPAAAMGVDILAMVLSVAAIVLLVPYLTSGFVGVFEKLYTFIFGNEGILAVKNLKDNKSLLNNISLLTIGISSLLMINTVSFSVVTEVANVFSNTTKYDIIMNLPNSDRSTERQIQKIDGVQSVYGLYQANGIEMTDYQYKISLVHGIDTNQYPLYWNIPFDGNSKEILDRLDSGRNIAVSNMLKKKFNLQIGDTLTLKMKSGEKDYRIAGFFNSLMQNGSYGIIPERYFKVDMQQPYFSELDIKTSGDADTIAETIKKQFSRKQPYVLTLREMKIMNDKANAQIFNILKGFSIMSMIIGIFGVLNNLIISFMERKRSLAVFRSMGMSKKQIIKMIFVESLTGGLIGGTIGIFGAILMISLVPYVMNAMDMPIPMHYSIPLFIQALIAGAAIMLAASISPALKSSKLNIIQSIKYE